VKKVEETRDNRKYHVSLKLSPDVFEYLMHRTSNHVEMWGYAPEKHPKRTFTQPDRAEKTTMGELMKAKKPAGDGMERDEFEPASSVVGFSGARFCTLKTQYFARETD
jgi:hypothetical protein